MDPTLAFSGNSAVWAAGDMTSVIIHAGSALAILRFKNTSDVPIVLRWRKYGTSGDGEAIELKPGLNSQDVTVPLTAERKVDYLIEGGGSIECWIINYGGSGVTMTVGLDDIRTPWLLNYSTDDLSDNDLLALLADISNEVDTIAARHLAMSGKTAPNAITNYLKKIGTAAQALNILRSAGEARGLSQEWNPVNSETVNKLYEQYNLKLDKLSTGAFY